VPRQIIVAGLSDPRLNRACAAVEIGRPLVRLPAEEPIKVLEPQSDRPLVEGAGRAVLVGRNVVVLAEPGGGVPLSRRILPIEAFSGPMTES
jgi:hypothetical protein